MPSETFILVPATITPEFCADSYARIRARAEALPEQALVAYNMSATSMAATVFAAAPKIAAYAPRIRVHAPTVAMEAIHDLVPIAAALVHTDIEYLASARPKKPFKDLAARASALRRRLHLGADVLVKLGVLDADALDEYDGSPSYKGMAKDLLILARVYRGRWKDIVGRSMTTEADLDEANVLSIALMRGVGEREQTSERSAAAMLARKRVFTLLAKVYGAARAAIAFVCALEGHGSVDAIAPSIYSGRKRDKAKGCHGPSAGYEHAISSISAGARPSGHVVVSPSKARSAQRARAGSSDVAVAPAKKPRASIVTCTCVSTPSRRSVRVPSHAASASARRSSASAVGTRCRVGRRYVTSLIIASPVKRRDGGRDHAGARRHPVVQQAERER